jgi:hypothetical protein
MLSSLVSKKPKLMIANFPKRIRDNSSAADAVPAPEWMSSLKRSKVPATILKNVLSVRERRNLIDDKKGP